MILPFKPDQTEHIRETTHQKVISVFGIPLWTLIALSMALPHFSATGHAAPDEQPIAVCPERPNGNRIARLVMTVAAAKYCKGFPHSEADVEASLQKLNCSEKTDKVIKSLKTNMMAKMQTLYEGPHASMMCAQATKYFKP